MLKMYIIISVFIAIYDVAKQFEGQRNEIGKINLIFFPSIFFEILIVKLTALYLDIKK